MGTSEGAAILAPPVKSSVPILVSSSPVPLLCVLDEALQSLLCSGRAFLDVIPGYPIDTTWMWTDMKGFHLGCLLVPSTPAPASHFPSSPSLSSLQPSSQPRPLPLRRYGYSNHCLGKELDVHSYLIIFHLDPFFIYSAPFGVDQLLRFFSSASPQV